MHDCHSDIVTLHPNSIRVTKGKFQMPEYLTVETIRNALQEEGYKAQIERFEDGRCIIHSGANGFRIRIFHWFSSDDSEKVTSLQYTSGYTATKEDRNSRLEFANKFNSAYRYARAYADDDGFWLDQDVIVFDGFTGANVVEHFRCYVSMQIRFVEQLKEAGMW